MDEMDLDFDEGIVLKTEGIEWIHKKEDELDELILTTKNLIYVVERSNGFFSKSTTEVTKVPLSEIKIINGRPQVRKLDSDDYGLCLQILFNHGRECFCMTKKEITQWIDEINLLLVGETFTDPNEEKRITDKFKGFAGFASNFKSVAESAIQTVSNIAEQIVEEPKVKKVEVQPSPKAQFQNKKEQDFKEDIPTQKIRYCVNCGVRIQDGAKFCQECGAKIGEIDTPSQIQPEEKASINEPKNNYSREQEYAGKILKCPNCGAVINQTTAICPECGMRITGQAAVSSMQAFKDQLMAIESTRSGKSAKMLDYSPDPADMKKLSLIRSYPIPNSVDDILEFMLLAIANVDVQLSKNTASNKFKNWGKTMETSVSIGKTISDAWVSKMQQAYQKAVITFPNDPMFDAIEQMYLEKMKELKIKVK
ncbi:MAG: zinc ribbon domain-containing protein [Coprobacillus cateniformis]|uniref:zinc ribbon domain-containing protein n=1 Tax=Longibaculum muris TaxID=1796628 RepID=UPI003AB8868D|nr:zinc ribbon domain-containing protein [Coprobacillus cateniformis]